MAGNWRIRHKLMLSMALMVSVLAFLLVGTLKGLSSYRTTWRTFGSKMDELVEADNLRNAIKALGEPSVNLQNQINEILDKTTLAQEALTRCTNKLQENVAYHQDPRYGFEEMEQLKAIEENLTRLKKELNEATRPKVVQLGEDPTLDLLRENSPVRLIITQLIRTAADLNDAIYRQVADRIHVSRNDYKLTMAFVISSCVIAVLLMAGLVRFFYRWICYPIRDLSLGVSRVANGDFEHSIQVHSGDEIEDLAKAFNDMTGRLREMYRDLAQQVNERSKQLIRSERLAGVGFLAAGVAHEINNPLASIAFCAEALDQRLSDLFQAESDDHQTQEREIISKYLKMIQEEAFRCKDITQRLLAFSRGSEQKREAVELGSLVQSVFDIIQQMPSCKGKELIFNPDESITAWVNAQEIKQVFLNLVVNAMESMDEGGRLTVTQQVKDGMAEVIFEDTGCGMTPDVLENIFEPFFTKSRTGKGTGLGLSISHRIITQHGGEIEARSPGRNQGSVFRVRLPLRPLVNVDAAHQDIDPEEEFVKRSAARAAA